MVLHGAKRRATCKPLPDGCMVLQVKTLTVPPRGTPCPLGTLRPQAKLCGISEQSGAPEV
jgi:hypothetical protein